ncbi:hypothetical protein PHMEG_00030587 [Phytophthora megakarya]|uniref:Peptidase A2 domain-containing protein n=1 Tax=Phytophthora megakarya TaxID=4795 RepID=A0A225V0W3_9STRA|nr:hypothetical protein PHMEG_00030587 [Phytophthora megakarya]
MELAETPQQLEAATQLLRMLKDAGITPGTFNASELFDLETSVAISRRRLTPTRSPVYQTGSSQYASATSEAESDSFADLQRMTHTDTHGHTDSTFFNAAMNRYLKETQTEGLTPTADRHTTATQDVEMESVESHHGSHGEYNLSIDTPRQAVIASAGAASAPSTATPRIRVSAISELKEYSGKDHEEDRARGWLGKVKSAFVRNQAPDSEKCLKAVPEPPSASLKNARAVQAIRVAEDNSESESDVSTSDQEDECRRVYLAEAKDRENHSITPTHRDGAADHPTMSQKNCTHCGSTKHDNLGCWKRLTYQKCGRKGHPSDHCLFVCRACGEMHEPGKCPTEEFYNLIRWNLVRAERSEICIYAFVEKRKTPKLDLLPGESRGYWKYHAPGKWFKQAKSTAKINNENATLLFDSGAEVSIVDSTVARKVGCAIDDSQKARVSWVGDLSGQEAILGMDFMVPAGIRLDMADGSLCLPDEVRIQLSGRRQLFSGNSRSVSDKQKLWVTRGEQWVPTAVKGLGNTQYLRITNVSERPVTLQRDTRVGIWLAGDHVPRMPGFVSIGSRGYAEWQNLALQAATEQQAVDEVIGTATEPM